MTLLECGRCRDYEARGQAPAEVGSVRSLAFYVCPLPNLGVWQRCLGQLSRRLDLFNGRRLVAVATGPGLDPPDAVRRLLGDRAEVLEVPHSHTLREVAAWLPLFERLADHAPGEVAFYGHAKGVSRPVNPGVTVHRWTEVMFETCLDYWPLVKRTLERHPIAGSFKKVGHGFEGSRSAWHYSGTFYWLRLADFYRRPWRAVDRVWWGTESSVGWLYAPPEAGVIFREGTVPSLNLYDWHYFFNDVIPDYERWKVEHAQDRVGRG